jgi:hypothetical protein
MSVKAGQAHGQLLPARLDPYLAAAGHRRHELTVAPNMRAREAALLAPGNIVAAQGCRQDDFAAFHVTIAMALRATLECGFPARLRHLSGGQGPSEVCTRHEATCTVGRHSSSHSNGQVIGPRLRADPKRSM